MIFDYPHQVDNDDGRSGVRLDRTKPRPRLVYEVDGLTRFIWTCSDVADIWDELELVRCPLCGAREDGDGVVVHAEPELLH